MILPVNTWEFIFLSIVVFLIYFSCSSLLAIGSRLMVGNISDSCRRKRSMEQPSLGYPQTSGSKSGSGSARCCKNNWVLFYWRKPAPGSLKQMFTTFKNNLSDSELWSVFFCWEGVLNKSKTTFTSLWMSRAPERLILAWGANDQTSRSSASCLFNHGVAWNQPQWRIYTMEMGKHYKSEHVCLRAGFLSPSLIIEDISFMHLFNRYLLTIFCVPNKVTKAW